VHGWIWRLLGNPTNNGTPCGSPLALLASYSFSAIWAVLAAGQQLQLDPRDERARNCVLSGV